MFEYAVQEFASADPDVVLVWLHQHGDEGWEAFAVEPVSGGYRLWLKRPRSVVAGGLHRSQE